MDVVSLCPLPVGIFAWESSESLLTVVVKATFTLDHDGEAALAEEQQPLALDRPSKLDPSELLAASDFAPWKALADVLVVGHAHSDVPSRVSPVSFQVDDLHRRFVAVAKEPSSRTPLSVVYLWEDLSESSAAVRVGPQSPRSQARFSLAGATAPPAWIDDHGTLRRPLLQGFDFRFFNAAPPEQQVQRLGEDAALRLNGLLPGASAREVRLPGILPCVFLLDQGSEGAEIELCCDTLLIDTDRAVCSLTWRGMLDRQCIPERASLIVTTQRIGEHLAWDTIARELDRGVITRAIEPPLEKEDRPAKRHQEEDEVTAPVVLNALVRPTPTKEDRPVTLRQQRDEVTATVVLDELVRASVEALPFRKAPEAPRPILKELKTTMPLDALAQASVEALPFRKAKKLQATTMPLEELVAASLEALPFKKAPAEAPSPPPAPRPKKHRAILPLDELLPAPVAAIPFTHAPPPLAPAPAAAPRPDDDLLPLESFAAIKMELWARPEARSDVLERHGLGEGTWRFQELRHTEALEIEAQAGGWERASALAEALLAAKAPR